MLRDTFLYFLSAAVLQNLVLHTGFGSSLLLRFSQRKRDLPMFLLLITAFSACTVLICFFLDKWMGSLEYFRLIRPIAIMLTTAVLYLAICLLAKKCSPRLYGRFAHILPMAAFNNLVVSIALIINYRVSLKLLPAIGFAVGSCVGFALLTVCVRACLDRTEHTDMPQSFRGLPIAMLYLGILALAFMGFSSAYTF